MMRNGRVSAKVISWLTAMIVFTVSLGLYAFRQVRDADAATLYLPPPTALVTPSASVRSPMLRGVRIDPENPQTLEFIVDPGDARNVSPAEAQRFIRYFFAGLTVPEKDLWVNLSPYEHDRVLAEGMEVTELGRDMLAQDYLLKQFSSSLTEPSSKTGMAYWADASTRGSAEDSLSANSPASTAFDKIWIVPGTANVLEDAKTVVISDATLRVLTDEDHVACIANKHGISAMPKTAAMRLLPSVTKEVNEGAGFARLRQMYRALILAQRCKAKLSDALYASYVGKRKLHGIDTADARMKEKVFAMYVASFKKGVYDVVADDAQSQGTKRRYFAGGLGMQHLPEAIVSSALGDGVVEKSGDIVVGVHVAKTEAADPVVSVSAEDTLTFANTDEDTFVGPHRAYSQAYKDGTLSVRTASDGRVIMSISPNHSKRSYEYSFQRSEFPLKLVSKAGKFFCEFDKAGRSLTVRRMPKDVVSRDEQAMFRFADSEEEVVEQEGSEEASEPRIADDLWAIFKRITADKYFIREGHFAATFRVVPDGRTYLASRGKDHDVYAAIFSPYGGSIAAIFSNSIMHMQAGEGIKGLTPMLVMHDSWVKEKDGVLYADKAIFMDGRDGDRFKFVVTSFADDPLPIHYGLIKTCKRNFDRLLYANKQVTTPVSSISEWEAVSGQKALAATIFTDAGVSVPRWQVWINPKDKKTSLERTELEGHPQAVFLADPIDRKAVLEQIRAFRAQEPGNKAVVVKPTRGSGGDGVKIFDAADSDAKVGAHVMTLLKEGKNPIIQNRIFPPVFTDTKGVQRTFDLRMHMTRDAQGDPMVSDITARVSVKGQPSNITAGALAVSYDELVQLISLAPDAAAALREGAVREAIKAFKAQQAAVDKRLRVYGRPMQQDCCGIDVIVDRAKDGTLTPVVLEVNGSNSGGVFMLDEWRETTGKELDKLGSVPRPVMENALRRGSAYRDGLISAASAQPEQTADQASSALNGGLDFGQLSALVRPDVRSAAPAVSSAVVDIFDSEGLTFTITGMRKGRS